MLATAFTVIVLRFLVLALVLSTLCVSVSLSTVSLCYLFPSLWVISSHASAKEIRLWSFTFLGLASCVHAPKSWSSKACCCEDGTQAGRISGNNVMHRYTRRSIAPNYYYCVHAKQQLSKKKNNNEFSDRSFRQTKAKQYSTLV